MQRCSRTANAAPANATRCKQLTSPRIEREGNASQLRTNPSLLHKLPAEMRSLRAPAIHCPLFLPTLHLSIMSLHIPHSAVLWPSIAGGDVDMPSYTLHFLPSSSYAETQQRARCPIELDYPLLSCHFIVDKPMQTRSLSPGHALIE